MDEIEKELVERIQELKNQKDAFINSEVKRTEVLDLLIVELEKTISFEISRLESFRLERNERTKIMREALEYVERAYNEIGKVLSRAAHGLSTKKSDL